MTAERQLRAMLPWLDTVIEREIVRLRARYQLSLDEFRGLYVSDAQVDGLLHQQGISAQLPPDIGIVRSERWLHMVARFGLTPVDEALLMLAVAPEIDARYPVIYAYLNDEAARRQPTIDMALRLIGDDWETRQAVRERLLPDRPLLASGLVRKATAWPEPAAALTVAPVATAWLLGLDATAVAGLSVIGSDTPPAAALSPAAPRLTIVEGAEASGRAALATAAAAAGGRVLLSLSARGEGLADRIEAALIAARLQDAALLLVADELADPAPLRRLVPPPVPVFIAAPPRAGLERLVGDVTVETVTPPLPPLAERRRLWQAALAAEGVRANPAAIDAAATRFRLPAPRIRRAARVAATGLPDGAGGRTQVTTEQLLAAARQQSALDLGPLATRVPLHAGWNDLVVSPTLRRQLQDFAGAVATRDRVFGDWGFGSVGRGAGRGLTALFAGVSGTGKTMTAAVIARETGFDLWRIDLSAAVSKYIGETEKNLDRIFSGARDGNAILFFDEADALFGKRSEVRDAHDRYANIEVAYLLQRLEEHDGVVILASNFGRNIDQAFLRRIHCSIEFAVPDAALRERLWRKALPPTAPVAGDIDFRFLSRQFGFPGGDIRAAALDAAFLAAGNGGMVTMEHLVHAVSRQMLKQGKLPMASEFGAYGGMLANGHGEAGP